MNESRHGRVRFVLGTCGAVAGVYLLWFLAVSPRGEFPLNDDWAYAWSVRHLLETGTMRISEWAAAAAVLPVWWGAVFAQLGGGFSFTALRISTLVFGVASPLALCWLLRRAEISRSGAALGAVALLANPIFFYLSFTFMTDVFFLSLMLVSLALYARGIDRDSAGTLWAGSAFAATAYLCRQMGVALPLAAAAVLLARRGRIELRPLVRVSLIPFAVFLAHSWWLQRVHGVMWGFRLNVVENGLKVLLRASAPLEELQRLLSGALYLGILTLPALVAVAVTVGRRPEPLRRLARPYLAWLLVLGTFSVVQFLASGHGMPVLENVINREGIGTLELQGTKAAVTPAWVFVLVTWCAPFAGAAQGALWTDALRGARRELAGPGAVLLVSGLFMAALTALAVKLWDEYLLVFLPAALFLPLRVARPSRRGWAAGAVVCAAMLAYALPEMADHMAWNRARWAAGRELVAQGVSPREIEGGFEWIGWYDFADALPRAIAAGRGDDLLGWMGVFPDRYFLAFQPLQGGRVVGSVPYRSRLGSRGTIYVLERPPS